MPLREPLRPPVPEENATPGRDVLPFTNTSAAPGFGPNSRHDIRDLIRVNQAPLVDVWRGTTAEGEHLALQVVRRELEALLPGPGVLASALAKIALESLAGVPRALWVEQLTDGRSCIASAWVERMGAADAVRETLLTPSVLSAVARRFCHVLDELHRGGCVLGVITPSSLAYLPDTGTFLVDGAGVFAALLSAGVRVRDMLTAIGQTTHVAPELLDDRRFDHRVDLYAFGSTLYELLTERAPFGGRTTAMIMASVLVETDTAEIAAPGAPVRDMLVALLRAIERAPDDRWPTAAAFALALGDGAAPAPGPARRTVESIVRLFRRSG